MHGLGLAHPDLDLQVRVVAPSWHLQRIHPEDRRLKQGLRSDIDGGSDAVEILVRDGAGSAFPARFEGSIYSLFFASMRAAQIQSLKSIKQWQSTKTDLALIFMSPTKARR